MNKPDTKPKLDAAAIASMMAARVLPPAAANEGVGNSSFLNPVETGVATLHVDDIEVYGRNPRTSDNPEFLSIKDSIRATGLKTPLTVTQIPGQARGKYTLAAGGGTRLAALKELHLEDPSNPLLARTTCLIVPYQGELQMLASHVIENTQRADMTWWDEAAGLGAIRDQLEADHKKTYSIRDLESQIKLLGLSTNRTMVAECLYTVAHLAATGSYRSSLKRTEVRYELQVLHTGLRSLLRLARETAQPDADAVWSSVLTMHFGLLASPEAYKFADLVQATHDKLAEMLGVSSIAVKSMVEALKQGSKLSYEVLLAASQTPVLSATGAVAYGEDGETAAGTDDTEADLAWGADTSRADALAVATAPFVPNDAKTSPKPPMLTSAPAFIPGKLVTDNPLPIQMPGPALGKPEARPGGGFIAVYEAAKKIAEYAGLDDCVCACADAPVGYYMDLPRGRLLEVAENWSAVTGSDHTTWWALHLISQVSVTEAERSAAVAYLPVGALLKVALKDEAAFEVAITQSVGEPLSMQCVALLLLWSCENSGRGELVRTFLACISSVQSSSRWITINSMPGGDA